MALADGPTSAVVSDLDQALAEQGLAGSVAPSGIDAPSDGSADVQITPGAADGPVSLATPQITLGLPADGAGTPAGSTTIYDGDHADNQIAVQPTIAGARALIHIISPDAPTTYRFALGGAAAALQQQADGSIAVLDENGATAALLPAPWARDAEGREIATRYEIDGTDVVQIVEHRTAGVSYPVVADPSVDLDPGWLTIKATFSKDVTNRVASLAVGAAGTAAAISEACSLIPNFALKAACKGIIAARAYNFINSARDARANGQCLYYQAPYAQLWSGWFGRSSKDCHNR
ncbi:hypothetical protein GKE82_25960 [Conexibacter sp. W3-3-2]|uniref:hypothetical protein n=1 Tax=Conexibacter sp. W3-3-2 TaxID=2675227 RepID=UPI0012B98DFD|nr:hypothetical protein [Conexibacter sp. W3-3-2]MTD47651.1 hypothetical protein [Conexibacter sp. W3-3-2]